MLGEGSSVQQKPRKCENCGEHSVSIVDDGQLVCTECGFVADDKTFELDTKCDNLTYSNIEAKNSLPTQYYQRTSFKKRPAAGELHGLKTVRDLSKLLKFNWDHISAIEKMYQNFYSTKYKAVGLETKEALATYCVYVTCRQQNYPIMMRWICAKSNCSFELFSKVFSELQKTHPPNLPVEKLEDYLPLICNKAGFDKQIENLALEIIDFCQDTFLKWSVYGAVIYVIVPVLFIAWKSCDVANRSKIKLNKFCQQNLKKFLSAKQKRFPAFDIIETALRSFAEEIPWLTSSDVEGQKYLYHIRDILKYKKSLQASMSMETQNTIIAMRNKPKRKLPEETASVSPPSVKYSRIENIDSSELTNDDIPDSDLHRYIRNAKEVEFRTKILNKIKSESETEQSTET
ncbi:transcription factor IIIB 50 kDa subunit-like [Tubulanus polymorphus]|uniref:transcription factor IIIB 50 kDa subunit-like n=1 Tax=Tubulanus polymorphus TaxID=672921 RepID=UPI003DA66C63